MTVQGVPSSAAPGPDGCFWLVSATRPSQRVLVRPCDSKIDAIHVWTAYRAKDAVHGIPLGRFVFLKLDGDDDYALDIWLALREPMVAMRR